MKEFDERIIKFSYDEEKDKKIATIIKPIYEMSVGKKINNKKISITKKFDKIKNKTDKLAFYRELMYKIYLLEHRTVYADVETILDNNLWYSAERSQTIYLKFDELVKAREAMVKAVTSASKIKINKRIKNAITELNILKKGE